MGLKVLIAYYSWLGTFNNDMYQTFDIAEKQYPTIQNLDLDPNQYDLILVGSPVWGGIPATPIIHS